MTGKIHSDKKRTFKSLAKRVKVDFRIIENSFKYFEFYIIVILRKQRTRRAQ